MEAPASKKRILLLIKGLGRGGAEQIIASSVPHLDRERFDYQLAYLVPWKDALVPELTRAGISCTCLDGARGFRWVSRLRNLVREQGVHLIHAHSPVPAIGARLAFGGHGPVLVYTEHGVWEHHHRATYWGNLLTFRHNSHVFAVSRHVQETIRYPRFLRRMRMPRVETIYHGIDPTVALTWDEGAAVRRELGIGKTTQVVGTVANFRPLKGHRDLLEAAGLVREQFPDVCFVLVGTGPIEPEIRRLARRIGLDGTVIFAGFRDDAPRVASAFDLFALASRYEGLSIALVEAMALGKPAVVTNVGGLSELIQHEREGLLVPPRDPVALAQAIIRLLGDRHLSRRLGDAARSRTSELHIAGAARRIEATYSHLLRETALFR